MMNFESAEYNIHNNHLSLWRNLIFDKWPIWNLDHLNYIWSFVQFVFYIVCSLRSDSFPAK